jgi:hypothetical protein
VKTATSLVIPIIVSSVLDEGLLVAIAHRDIVEMFQQVVDVIGWSLTVGVRRRWLSTHLQLAMQEIANVNHGFVIANMSEALLSEVCVKGSIGSCLFELFSRGVNCLSCGSKGT